jgi:hypothetical protein
MANETATATVNPTSEATATVTTTTEAPATLLATATSEEGKQTQTTETPAAPATETPAAESKTPETKTETKTPAAPEKYEFKAPEGTEYDPGILDAFSSAAKEADLSQEAAQMLIEKMAPALAARQVGQVEAIHKEWLEASSADKEFGGEKLQENLGVARKALDAFGTPELRSLLDTTGLGNHPEVIRLLFKAGKAISEDTFTSGRKVESSGGATSFYPNSKMT